MIVGTAGHIDHGKTTLVKALTGVDTDRLPEEKARGISIDLGFAYCRLSDGALLGFVDMPGHAGFVRTMIAGAAGVDCALLIVAADDGVMPQTREHVKILDILGLRSAIVVISKIDRADAQRIVEVIAEVEILLAPTGLYDAPRCLVSAKTGEGIANLRAQLQTAAQLHRRRTSDDHPFRFAIDRAFLAGGGVVVTGFVIAGVAQPGRQLVHFPSGLNVQIKRIRVHDTDVEQASPSRSW